MTDDPMYSYDSDAPPDAGPAFEDRTLAQALGDLWRAPSDTVRRLWRILTREPGDFPVPAPVPALPDTPEIDEDEPPFPATDALPAPVEPSPRPKPAVSGRTRGIVLALALLLAITGGGVLHGAATDLARHARRDTGGAALWFVLAGALVLGFELFASRLGWARRFPRAASWLRRVMAGRPGVIVAFSVALWLALVGVGGLWGSALWLALAALLWLALCMAHTPPPPVELEPSPTDDTPDEDADLVVRSRIALPEPPRQSAFWAWLHAHAFRLLLVGPALVASALTYTLNVARAPGGEVTDVVLTPGGVIAWAISVALWVLILAGFQGGIRWRPRLARPGWTLAALAAILVMGAAFRLHDLSSTPPEMTSDHIEKLLDAVRVSEGYYGVFFPNNGGREGFQMMLVALIAQLPGVGFSFTALKLATALEGLVTLPALWWMARQVFGDSTDEARRLGNWTGLALAGLVAVSAWHVMLSRLGLRIALTPLTTALVIGFLARAMRHNRTRDYLALGAVLGAGVYFYQANRMLPIVAVIGIGLALLGTIRKPADLFRLAGEVIGFAALAAAPVLIYGLAATLLQESGQTGVRDLGERLAAFLPLWAMLWFSLLVLVVRARRGDPILQYGGGLLAAAVIALTLVIPMAHYEQLYPDYFWNRTQGRMFGEDAFTRVDPDTGALVNVQPSLREQVDLFWDRRDVFEQNYRDALRMFHWEGDGAWINNAHSAPALGGLAGGLLILGLIVWGVRAVRLPDAALWLIPASVLVMLLPSAMTLAYTIENPSFTRASGAIPGVFLLAALPVGMLCAGAAGWTRRVRAWTVPAGVALALVLLGGIVWRAAGPDWNRFFTDYRLSYSYSWKPYRAIAQPLRGFSQNEGSYGNAFMIAFPHWLDHRILGAMAGDIRWPNGLVTREDVFHAIARNRGTRYEYDPARPLFFMYHTLDEATGEFLRSAFPGGETALYEYTYETDHGLARGSFAIYRAMAGPVE